MASDEERHEVAARLRRFLSKPWDERVWEHDGLQTVGRLVGTSVGENIIERLADLIDRPTCHDVGNGDYFVCSECGCLKMCLTGLSVLSTGTALCAVPRFGLIARTAIVAELM